MEDALKDAKEDKERLKDQYEEEISLMQQRLRAEYDEQRKMIEADNQKLRDEIASRRDVC